MRTILLSLMIFGIAVPAAPAGETTGAQYADPMDLPVVLDNSGGAGISAGVGVEPVRGNWRPFKKKGASANTTAGGASAAGGGQSDTCSGPSGNVRVYNRASPEPGVADFDTLFDLNAPGVPLVSSVEAGKPKAYEFNNDKGYLRGRIYVFYKTGPVDIAISACPGNFNVPEGCKDFSNNTTLYWSKNGAQFAPLPSFPNIMVKTCNIGAGGKVYLNIRAGGEARGSSYQLNTSTLR